MRLAFDSEEDQLQCQRKARGWSKREREMLLSGNSWSADSGIRSVAFELPLCYF